MSQSEVKKRAFFTLIDFLKPTVNQGLASNFCLRFDIHLEGACYCLIDEFVKPGERLIGVGMLANTSPINNLQVVIERFCIEGGIITDLGFIV